VPATKRSKAERQSASGACEAGKSTIDSLRERIDRIDAHVLKLLNQRARLALRIGHAKMRRRSEVYVPGRERGIYDQLFALNQGPLPNEAVRAIYREIISASRVLEKPLCIAYLGPEATFTHIAAREQFGSQATFVSAETIPQVFAAVERGHADYGAVPVENSTEGVVGTTLDMFVESPLNILSELSLEIRHCLLSHSGFLKRIKRVLSHPQSLAQCRRWLATHLPGVPVEETTSNARAAEIAAQDSAAAAIAGKLAAERYGLKIVAEGIQDQSANLTRFVVIGQPQDNSLSTGHDKTSILFSVRDEVGVLYRMLKPFAENRINLIHIESRPLKGRPWEYLFFLDVEGHLHEERIDRAVQELAKGCLFVKVLGSYPVWR
jgi:chorismate mutase/prephenate dehydratase